MIQIPTLYEYYKKSNGLVTDSRKVTDGTIYFALKGEKFDGNDFAEEAIASGAKYVVVDRPTIEGDNVLLVENVLETLQKLAAYHRSRFDIPVIAITGSCAKTTTKELIKAVLSQSYNVVATRENFNNHIGVPLSLFDIDEKTQIAVIEMGASAPGEIASLVNIVNPTCGIITNVGNAHIEGFGSFEAVKKTKAELYDYLRQKGLEAFYNVDDEILRSMISTRAGMCTVKYGVDYQGIEIVPPTSKQPYLQIALPIEYVSLKNKNTDYIFVDKKNINDSTRRVIVDTQLIGDYNVDNVLAAIAIGQYYKVSLKKCVEAIEAYQPTNHRSQLIKTDNNTLIVDTYNANPASMTAALTNFGRLNFQDVVLILGDMKELGPISSSEHFKTIKLAQQICSTSLSHQIYLVGNNMKNALDENLISDFHISCFADVEELNSFLKENPVTGKTVLIKGSHSNHLEKTIEYL